MIASMTVSRPRESAGREAFCRILRSTATCVAACVVATGGTVGCTSLTERTTTAKSVPHASQDADIIVDRYRNDPKLGDDLFNDKTVEITAFRVDAVDGGTLSMTERGYTLRLSGLSSGKAKVGDVLTLVCEGDGMDGETTILFEGCSPR